jgi:hypothetical protein
MTIVDWAHVVLPLGALFWGAYLTWKYSATINRWVDAFDRFLRTTK